MNKQDVITLYKYNQWANNRILRAAGKVSEAQLTEPIPWLSGETLLQTMTHVLDAEWSWRLVCEDGKMPGEYLAFSDLAALRKAWREEMKSMLAYVSLLEDGQLNQMHIFTRPRFKPRHQLLWHILVHVVNHSTHHRAEIGQYLATCSYSPGDMDFMIFVAK